MKVYFIVEEEGCEVYATNDTEGRYFDYRFVVSSCVDGDYDTEEFKTKEEAWSMQQEESGVILPLWTKSKSGTKSTKIMTSTLTSMSIRSLTNQLSPTHHG